nr:glycosyltransferase family 4 protein [uncultured Anaerosporobacter sp.]
MKEKKMNMENNTILFVMPRLPFPATSGRKTSLYHYCRILSKELGFRLIVAAFLENDDDPSLKPDFIKEIIILPKPSGKVKIANIIKDSILLRNKPMQVSLYWNKSAKKIIDEIVSNEKPAFVIADMVRTTEYIRDLHSVRIADLDDRISIRYKRQMETDMGGINPYGAYLSTLPDFLQKIMLWAPVKNLVVKNEIALLNKYELEMGRICEHTVFVAQGEATSFNDEIGSKKALAIPIGVDIDYFNHQISIEKSPLIGFLGAMNVAHNEYAAINFISNILPIILQEKPECKFMVIGGGASERLLKYKSENVIFTGRVDDVREYLGKCKVFVCPMIFGSGIKTKNLEAMSMRLPVVTTSIGAENIHAISGKDWIVADKATDFADSVIALIDDEKMCEKIGQNARKFILSNYTWDVAKEQFSKLLFIGKK